MKTVKGSFMKLCTSVSVKVVCECVYESGKKSGKKIFFQGQGIVKEF